MAGSHRVDVELILSDGTYHWKPAPDGVGMTISLADEWAALLVADPEAPACVRIRWWVYRGSKPVSHGMTETIADAKRQAERHLPRPAPESAAAGRRQEIDN